MSIFVKMLLSVLFFLNLSLYAKERVNKEIAYLVSDLRIPFWEIMSRGVAFSADKHGYDVKIYSANNNAKKELQYTVKAIKDGVDAIVVSPTTSAACATILKFAKKANIPVVISDIGTDRGEYLSYISSNNFDGAYKIGKLLTKKLIERGWEKGKVAIVAIPQKRSNGQERTAGFMKALNEAGIKGGGIKQQVSFSYQETYDYVLDFIGNNPDIRAVWLQGSNRYKGALDAIEKSGKKEQILLTTFDAEPEFLNLIPKGTLVGSAMQQPYLMGEIAVDALHRFFSGQNVEKNIKLPILAVSAENIDRKFPLIKRNVLGITKK